MHEGKVGNRSPLSVWKSLQFTMNKHDIFNMATQLMHKSLSENSPFMGTGRTKYIPCHNHHLRLHCVPQPGLDHNRHLHKKYCINLYQSEKIKQEAIDKLSEGMVPFSSTPQSSDMIVPVTGDQILQAQVEGELFQ